MRLDNNRYLADLGHSILGRIVRVFLNDTFSFGRLDPVLFKNAFVDPFLA